MLKYIIPSKARRKILGLFYKHPTESYHLRRVSREVDLEINAVKRELDILEEGKILIKEKRLNKSVYSLNSSYMYFDEFMRIFAKQHDLITLLVKNKNKLGKIHFASVSLKFFQQEPISDNEVYILFVGVVVAAEIQKIVQEIEKEFPYEINYTIMTKDELAYRKRQNDPFIWSFLKEPKIMIFGSEAKLMA